MILELSNGRRPLAVIPNRTISSEMPPSPTSSALHLLRDDLKP